MNLKGCANELGSLGAYLHSKREGLAIGLATGAATCYYVGMLSMIVNHIPPLKYHFPYVALGAALAAVPAYLLVRRFGKSQNPINL